jgi:flavin reductase (DIM6/NTAB) family NADH-FMN oxidoreductase RutF
MIFDLKEITIAQRQNYLQSAIAPRPIALVSTVNQAGQINLSPFSFFNLFSAQPPILVFSPSLRVRDNSTKHTLENILEVPQAVVHIVDYDMVNQTSLSSCEYPKEINEFLKSGFTQEPASLVRPPMVKESKIKMECQVLEVKPLGEKAGAGNLVISEILLMHIDDSILNEQGLIDQRKLQQVGRLGGNWYCQVDASNLFEVEKPNTKLGVGFDALPSSIRQSRILTGNDLALLANFQQIPDPDTNLSFDNIRLKNIFQYFSLHPDEMEKEIHLYAKELISEGKLTEAWQALLRI